MATALVTGDAGFIGSYFTDRLAADGWHVEGCDITTGTDALPLLEDPTVGGYDLLVHAAANVGGRVAIDGDPLWVSRNLALDQAAFRFAVRTKTPLLYFSSSAVYPIHLQEAHRRRSLTEDDQDPQGTWMALPDQTYGWTKLTGEVLAGYARAAGATVHVVRPFSGYGETQSTDYPFPAFVARAVAREDPFVVWGNGGQTRDFTHVSDVYAGCMAIVADGEQRPVNLGTGIPTSFLRLASLVTREAGYSPAITTLPDKPTGVPYRVGDPTRLLALCPPRVTLIEGIRSALLHGRA